MRLTFNLFQLKQDLEKQKGVEISWAEIGRRADVHPNTLVAISKSKARRVDLETLDKLYNFFHAEGMPIQPGDLLAMERGD